MRVPNSVPSRHLLEDLGRVRSELERARREISTGKRISTPGDDPAAAARAAATRDGLAEIEEYRTATASARARLLSVDSVIDSLERLMDAAASAAAAGQSAELPPIKLQTLSRDVDGQRTALLALANSKEDGVYLFSGERTLTQAFDSSAAYQGDGNPRVLRVGEQSVVETSIPGADLFVSSLDGFQVLADLRDALAAGNGPAIAAGLTQVEQVADRFRQYRTRVGLTLAELDRNDLRLTAQRTDETLRLHADVDADLAEAISRFNNHGNALEAALGVGARILPLSLMDVLG